MNQEQWRFRLGVASSNRPSDGQPFDWVVYRCDRGRWRRFAALSGQRLHALRPWILRTLRLPSERRLADGLPIEGEAALRVALVMRAVAGIRRPDAALTVAAAVEQMAVEECAYWFAQCSRDRKGCRALRVLVGAEP